MDIDNLINDIDKLIEVSRYFLYDSEKKAEEHRQNLSKLIHQLEKGKLDKVFREGGDELDDS